MKGAAFLLLALCLIPSFGDCQEADSSAAPIDWSAGDESLPAPEDATELALRFLEWRSLGDWARAELAGNPSSELGARWSSARRLRLGEGVAAPDWDLTLRRRGLCLFEERNPDRETLLAYCDRLASGGYRAAGFLIEGILEAYLLERSGLSGCGRRDDPATALSLHLGAGKEYSLEELKEGVDFASLYFAAEREVERWQRRSLSQVEDFLSRPGLLISLRYGFRRILSSEAPVPATRTDAEHWIYPDGFSADWGKGRRFEARGLPVLHTPGQNLIQVIDPDPALALYKDNALVQAPQGEFELRGRYRLETGAVRIDLDGGRYRRKESELRLWWPGSFFESNRKGFLFALLILLVTVYLSIQNQRKKRELARSPRRPRSRR